MRSIDIHAHVTPQSYMSAMREGLVWHGLEPRDRDIMPQLAWTPDQRLKDMDSLGVDVQVASTGAQFYFYERDGQAIADMHRECNDEVHQMTIDYPERFKGLAQIPMQDVDLAIAELDRCVNQLGMVGAMIDDKVNGKTFDEPEFLPLWKAAEQMGAVFLIHQGGGTLVNPRTRKYHLPNTIGNLVDRAVTFASFVMGGVMDACPDLKICLAHGGGYACYGVGRMDRSWDVGRLPQIPEPPSAYLSRFYYDCLTHSESALRMLIDMAGIDKVVFGTDWPFDMQIDWPVSWVLSLESLTQDEKEAILWKNMEKLLGVSSD